MRRLAKEYPDSNQNLSISVERFWNDFLPRRTRANLYLLMGAVGFVLLIACANMANLLLSRGVGRQKEIAIRVSLGASRWRIFRQLITESLVLSFLGGLLGIGLSSLILKAVMTLMPEDTLTIEAEVRISFPVLLFTAGSAILAGLIFGCIPAWNVVRQDLNQALSQVARSLTFSRKWTQRTLIVTEFALALTLLTGAGLAIHSLWNITNLDLGVRTDHVLTFYLPMNQKRFATVEQAAEFHKRVLENLQSAPGVQNAALSTGLPLTGSGLATDFTIARQAIETGTPLRSGMDLVTPGFFETYGIHFVKGRSFTEQDRAGTLRVTVINEDFARRFLNGKDPLGQQIVTGDLTPGTKNPNTRFVWQIVGVYRGVKDLWGLDRQNTPEFYLPFWQTPYPGGIIAVRTAADPTAMRKAISRVVHSIDPNLPLAGVKTLDEVRDKGMASDRFTTMLYSAFAGLALLLAAAGIYGVMTYSVSQRTREIGLRAALGADANRLLWLIVREGVQLALAGLVVGLGGAYLVISIMRSMLFGVGRLDFEAVGAVTVLLLGSALIASYVPARRAARIDPMVALREE